MPDLANIANAGTDHVINAADVTSAQSLEAVTALAGAAITAGGAPLRLGSDTVQSLAQEAEIQRASFINTIKRIKEAARESLSAIVP